MSGAALAAAVLAFGAPHDPGAGHGTGDRPVVGAEIEQVFAAFSPADVNVVTGDSVRWHNASVRAHTVTADDGSFDSGRMSAGEEFTHAFPASGPQPYHCRVHAGMSGVVRVHDMLLSAPRAAATPRRPFPLHGRAAVAAGTPVTIEADTGAGFAPVARTTVEPGGSFAASVVATTTAAYRAVGADRVSPPVQLLVLDRRVDATSRRRGRQLTVTVHVAPASPGQTVVLQLHLPSRFGWWPVQRAKLDARSQATFRMRLRRSPPARVALTLSDGATVLARSAVLSTRR